MTPEQRCERVRMALAEAGYPDADVRWCGGCWDDEPGHVAVVTVSSDPEYPNIPDSVYWRSQAVAGEPLSFCWGCFSNGAEECDHDPLTSPWPEVVR